jgi:hypothetical protein
MMTQPDAAYVLVCCDDDANDDGGGHQCSVLLDAEGHTITQPYVANAAYVMFYSNTGEFDLDEEDTYDDDNDGLQHLYVQTYGRSHKIYYNTEGEAISPPIYRSGPSDTASFCIALTINAV